jgi:hypothetical protein
MSGRTFDRQRSNARNDSRFEREIQALVSRRSLDFGRPIGRVTSLGSH